METVQSIPTESERTGKGARSRIWVWGTLLLIILVTAGIRIRLRDLPLERDEGEYAYAGQLLLQGIPPYQLAYNMKFPGTYVAYAVMMGVFGQSAAGIHLGFLLVNVANILMVYLLTRKFASEGAGLAAAGVYAYLSLSQGVLGLCAHATHFVLLAALPGLLFLLRGTGGKEGPMRAGEWMNLLVSGVLLGIGVLMKQHGAVFVVFAAGYLFYCASRSRDWKRLAFQWAVLGIGVAVPLVVTGLWLWKAGVFEKFWFWTVLYGRHYAAEHPDLAEIVKKFLQGMPAALYPALYLAACGLVVLARTQKEAAVFAGGLLAVSVVALFPNFNFRPHYFVLVLPAVSLLVGVAVSRAYRLVEERKSRETARLVVGLFVAALLVGCYLEREVFFLRTPVEASRWMYARSGFAESVAIGRYIREHADKGAKVAVLGSEPEIYFYAQRHSATGYIYTYALMEPQPYALQMQKEMISEIESNRPEYAVLVQDMDSWVVRTNSNQMIIDWLGPYLHSNYEKVGLAENYLDGKREIRWGEEARNRTPVADVYLGVYRRR